MIGSSGPLPEGYRFVRNLGLGGSGWVVLARQEQLDRLVAVKTLLTGTRDQAGLKRLEREGRVLVGLQNPHIVRVFALLPSRDGIALVMEYVPGGDLRQLIEASGIGGAQAVRLLSQVASGLQHAHAQGVVHRDIKPANLLLTAAPPGELGQVKIADFGLARLPRAAGAFRTSEGNSSGTPAYMAPEQITDPAHESPAIDVYAFSVLAYQLLTGQLPLRGDNPAQLLQAHLHENPLHPGILVPGFPGGVGDVLLAGLAKDPGARPSLPDLVAWLTAIGPAEWDAVVASGRRIRSTPALDPATAGATGTDGATEVATETGDATQGQVSNGAASGRAASERPAVAGPGPGHSAPFVVPDTVYRPPPVPLLHRRLVYLGLALGFGAVIGVVLALGVR